MTSVMQILASFFSYKTRFSVGQIMKGDMLQFFILAFTFRMVSCGGLFLSNFNICHGPNYTVWSELELKNVTGGQSWFVQAHMTEPIGNDNKFECIAHQRKPDGTKRQVFKMRGPALCRSLNRLGGRIWLDVEKVLEMPNPGKCPIPQKDYRLNWYTLRYGEIPFFAMIPLGSYNLYCHLLDNDGKLIKGCVSMDASKTL